MSRGRARAPPRPAQCGRPSSTPRATCPHYRDLFRHEDIDPREIRGADDLARLPRLTREELLRDPARFRSDARDARDGVTLRSSGTTGESLRLFHDRRSVLLNVAYSERERAVEAAFVGKRLRYTRLYLSPDAVENVARVRGLAAQESFRPFRPRYRLEHFNRPRDELLRLIERIRPDVLAGSGSVLEAFFRVTADARRAAAPAACRDLRLGRDDGCGARADRADVRHPRAVALQRHGVPEDRLLLRAAARLPPARGSLSCPMPSETGELPPLQPLQPRLRRSSTTGSATAGRSRTSPVRAGAARACSSTSTAAWMT